MAKATTTVHLISIATLIFTALGQDEMCADYRTSDECGTHNDLCEWVDGACMQAIAVTCDSAGDCQGDASCLVLLDWCMLGERGEAGCGAEVISCPADKTCICTVMDVTTSPPTPVTPMPTPAPPVGNCASVGSKPDAWCMSRCNGGDCSDSWKCQKRCSTGCSCNAAEGTTTPSVTISPTPEPPVGNCESIGNKPTAFCLSQCNGGDCSSSLKCHRRCSSGCFCNSATVSPTPEPPAGNCGSISARPDAWCVSRCNGGACSSSLKCHKKCSSGCLCNDKATISPTPEPPAGSCGTISARPDAWCTSRCNGGACPSSFKCHKKCSSGCLCNGEASTTPSATPTPTPAPPAGNCETIGNKPTAFCMSQCNGGDCSISLKCHKRCSSGCACNARRLEAVLV